MRSTSRGGRRGTKPPSRNGPHWFRPFLYSSSQRWRPSRGISWTSRLLWPEKWNGSEKRYCKETARTRWCYGGWQRSRTRCERAGDTARRSRSSSSSSPAHQRTKVDRPGRRQKEGKWTKAEAMLQAPKRGQVKRAHTGGSLLAEAGASLLGRAPQTQGQPDKDVMQLLRDSFQAKSVLPKAVLSQTKGIRIG